MTLVIETRGLTKRYGDTTVAVDGLDLRVRRGEVYGFLGPNGAGKTTTLRMLLGLVRPTSGSAAVLGAAPGAPDGLARIGAMVETPGFYPHLSGRDNLRVVARYAGVHEDRVFGVLEQVRLSDRADDRFRAYSLGMKQRLGVAAALLKDPELLILDEPSNGLDPAGMAEMRELIRTLAGAGRTVLLSSHLMGEVEHVSDRVGVIRGGALIAEGTVAELRGRAGLRLRAEPLADAARVIRALPGVDAVTAVDGRLSVTVDTGEAAAINRALVGEGIAVSELVAETASLEDVFLALTGERRMIAAELLVLRKRPATWILLGIWTFLGIFFAYVVPYALDSDGVRGGVVRFLPESLVGNLLAGIPFFGGVFALMLGVFALGSEYGWDTLKTLFTQRPGRLRVLAAKLAALALVLLPFVLALFAAGAVASVVIAGIEDAPVHFPSLWLLVRALAAGWVILFAWGALGVALGVLTRGTSLAIGVGILYALVIEGLLSAFADSVLKPLTDVLLRANGYSIAAALGASTDTIGDSGPGSFSGPFVGGGQALVVLLALTAAFVAVAGLLVRRRDVA